MGLRPPTSTFGLLGASWPNSWAENPSTRAESMCPVMFLMQERFLISEPPATSINSTRSSTTLEHLPRTPFVALDHLVYVKRARTYLSYKFTLHVMTGARLHPISTHQTPRSVLDSVPECKPPRHRSTLSDALF